ncbi:hypothetical protein JP72_24730 [Salmonella enterica subsp. enterica serovar Senftenberg]|uniref:hypothetical protein n=1 Tax=Enterobacter TaxID=547 RepID=UPI000A8A74DA|nr:hypothetical protein [Enterobacter roggenkampii]EBB7619382.1 hypothetical protein [Salmonella enterica subsp. enterica serovar Senftenberg]
MNTGVENTLMRTSVSEIRPLPGGECYEAKVTHIYDSQGNEIPLPESCHGWGMAWGKTETEAREKAEGYARAQLNTLRC